MPDVTSTLLLHPRYDEDSQLAWMAAVSEGWQVERHGWNCEPEVKPYVLYGGWEWARRQAKRHRIDLLTISPEWLTTLPVALLGRKVWLSSIGDVRHGAFPVFVKSLRGKQITSRIYHSPNDIPDVGDDIQALVSETLLMLHEYRTFVLDGKVVTASKYATYGRLNVEPYALPSPVLQDILSSIAPSLPRAVVIDFAASENGVVIVEANDAWCSGIYACDPKRVLSVLAAASGIVL